MSEKVIHYLIFNQPEMIYDKKTGDVKIIDKAKDS